MGGRKSLYLYIDAERRYNSPIDLEEFPIDVGYWSTFGKTDDIVLGNSEGNWFDIEPGVVPYGTDIYRNEGFMFGFYGYWTGLESWKPGI